MLMEHNIPVYKKFDTMLKDSNQCIIVSTTGTGKSYIVDEYLEKYDMKALVIGPTIAICNEWNKLTNRVNTITYHNFYRNYESYYDGYDCYVFDEAHHMGGKKWGKIIRIFRDHISVPVIGLTATPTRHSDSVDVAIEFFDSCTVTGYDQAKAIEKGILPRANYIYAFFDGEGEINDIERKIKNINDKAKTKYLHGRLSKTRRNLLSVKEILQKHINYKRKGIVFTDSIKSIDSVVELIKSTFPGEEVLYIHSGMTRKKVLSTLDKFRSLESGYIVNIDMLKEGLHISNVNTVIMLRKTYSPAIFIQQIGRALASGSKDNILVFDFVGNSRSLRYLLPDDEEESEIDTEGYTNERRHPIYSEQNIIADYTSPIVEILDEVDQALKDGWTDEEDGILLRYYPNEGRKSFERLPNKTEQQCFDRLKYLKAFSDRQYKPWSIAEDKIINEYYEELSIDELKKNYLPDRSIHSIINRARYLGFIKKDRWTEDEDRILIENWNSIGIKVMSELPSKTKFSIYRRLYKLGILK